MSTVKRVIDKVSKAGVTCEESLVALLDCFNNANAAAAIEQQRSVRVQRHAFTQTLCETKEKEAACGDQKGPLSKERAYFRQSEAALESGQQILSRAQNSRATAAFGWFALVICDFQPSQRRTALRPSPHSSPRLHISSFVKNERGGFQIPLERLVV
ncbi:hypothetical protein U0070_017930 [Myodes glareolus]|uniref:Uncharacterized protein n=1 Tax=Myodes glareolus TaxID=447135 RepID=A0AAW0KA63_MYOGA